ncbi:MAG: MFS transporter [Deltaproteobacteria bacterium]|nr:MFS transporter [Deltaproteobacteria bacterium]
MPEERHEAKTLRMAWIVLAAAFLMQMVFSGIHFAFGVFLKPIAEEFEWSRGATAFAYTLLWWVSSPAALFLGMLSDRIGTRRVLVFGAVVFGLGIFLSSQIRSLWQFYIYFGLLAGIGRGADRAPLLSAVLQFFNRRRGLAMGITLSGTGLGTIIFPSLGRYVISVADWRVALTVMGLVSWVLLIPAAMIIRNPRPGEAEAADSKRKAMAGDDIGGILGSPDKDWSPIEVLKNRVFWIAVATGIACCVSHSLPLAHIVAFASDLGIADFAAAGVLSVIGITAAIGRLLWGVISDRIGGRKTVMWCIILQTIAMFLVAFAETPSAFYLFAVGFGLAYGGVLPQYPVVIRELFGMRRFGTVYGMHSFATSIGMGGGGIVGGYLFDVSGSYFVPFMTSTGLGLIASAFAVHLASIKKPTAPPEERELPLQEIRVPARV